MKKNILPPILTAALLTSFGTQAADNTEVKAWGVIRPAACIPTIAGGGVVDYGTIPAKSLTAGALTSLPDRQVELLITCDSDMSLGITSFDNRANSQIDLPVDRSGINFGLGLVKDKKVGSYTIAITDGSSLDGVTQPSVYFKRTNEDTWLNSGVNFLLNGPGLLYSIGSKFRTPGTGKQWNIKLKIAAKINTPENLDMTGDVPLDGSASIEVKYL